MTSSSPYKTLCAEFYHLDKPSAPQDALSYYFQQLEEIKGPILEPMCGTGNFLIPITKAGYQITGFDDSQPMLDICQEKCQTQNISCDFHKSDFQSFTTEILYGLVIVPNGSFCLLTNDEEADFALNSIHTCLQPNGKFIVEVETLSAKNNAPAIWRAKAIKKADGSTLILNYVAQFNEDTAVETTLCRYEHWKNNEIIRIEVEEFNLKLYEPEHIRKKLERHGFIVTRCLEPYGRELRKTAPVILYECIKGEKE